MYKINTKKLVKNAFGENFKANAEGTEDLTIGKAIADILSYTEKIDAAKAYILILMFAQSDEATIGDKADFDLIYKAIEDIPVKFYNNTVKGFLLQEFDSAKEAKKQESKKDK